MNICPRIAFLQCDKRVVPPERPSCCVPFEIYFPWIDTLGRPHRYPFSLMPLSGFCLFLQGFSMVFMIPPIMLAFSVQLECTTLDMNWYTCTYGDMEGCRATGLGKWLKPRGPLLIAATVSLQLPGFTTHRFDALAEDQAVPHI